ncbi:hypothetical protein [Acinetobacter junii]|uniref:hypothetical protein n=1 Tax=Acinetobacter junii TaxID=40215 RepID=UPI001D188E85|nr:hypothetical protein [Acinetobacter junii]
MTVQVTERLSQLYVGNGVNTRFDFSFRVFDQEDENGIAVRIRVGNEFEFLDESKYSVTINQEDLGGFVTFIEAPNTQTFFYIAGKTPVDQQLDITNYDNFYPDAIERALDKLTAILQEWKHLVDFESQSRLLADIDYDQLAQNREAELKAYIDGIVSSILGSPVIGLPAQFVADGNENQKQINDKTIRSFDSIAALLAYTPRGNGQTVYVKSYYAGLNVGGGEFVYKQGAAETEIPGFVMNITGGVWKRVIKHLHSIDDAGAHPTQTAAVNANAINKILSFIKAVHIPVGDYAVLPDVININAKNTFFGEGRLVGISPDTLGVADGTGTYINMQNVDTAVIKGITLKNGYQSKAILCQGSKNIIFDDVVTDGFTYGMWIGENGTGDGCQNIMIRKPKILNTRYWGIYVRCLYVTDEKKKTQNIVCEKPYFYNCNMAAWVCAEGNVKFVTLDTPFFQRCNMSMHFETTTDYTVINPRDYDTGKKPDHVPSNTEYPYTNWSMYHAFTSRGKIIGGTLEKSCYHYAANGGGSEAIEYYGTTALDFVFEGGGFDASRVFFQNYRFDSCTAIGALIYQLPGADNFLRNFVVNNCTSLLGKAVDTGAGDGNLVAISAPRTVNFKANGCTIYNSCFRITGFGHMIITGNNFIGGTNNTQSRFDGVSGAQLSGNILDFSGNVFERAGGVVIGDSAFLISNFARVRTDNTLRTTCNYGYRFTNNFRIEYGKSYVLGAAIGAYIQSGTIEFITM